MTLKLPSIHSGDARQIFSALVVSLAMMMQGFIHGWISPMVDYLQSSHPPVNLTLSQTSWLMGASSIGAVLSPIPSALLMDCIGRKYTLLLLYTLPASSWVVIYFAEDFLTLFFARCVSGMWFGIGMTVCPVYVGEIADPHLRSFLGSFTTLIMYLGICSAFIFGSFVSYNSLSLIGFVLSVCGFILLLIVPETPYYYCLRSKKIKGLESLKWLRGSDNNDFQEEYNRMEKFVEADLQNQGSLVDVFKNAASLKAFMIVLISTILFRANGGNLFVILPIVLPEKVFFSLTKKDSILILGILLTVFSARPKFLLKLGIRFLLISSSILCGLAMTFMTLWEFFKDKSDLVHVDLYWVPFASFCVFNISYAAGASPVVVALKGEMLPTGPKSLLSGIITIFGNFTSYAVLKSFYVIKECYGSYVNYAVAGAASYILLLFTYFFIIETEGKSLEEIQSELKNRTHTKDKTKNIP